MNGHALPVGASLIAVLSGLAVPAEVAPGTLAVALAVLTYIVLDMRRRYAALPNVSVLSAQINELRAKYATLPNVAVISSQVSDLRDDVKNLRKDRHRLANRLQWMQGAVEILAQKSGVTIPHFRETEN